MHLALNNDARDTFYLDLCKAFLAVDIHLSKKKHVRKKIFKFQCTNLQIFINLNI